MSYIARIDFDSREKVANQWMSLIDSHAALRHPPPRIGINPFTRQPWKFYAPGSTAEIIKDGVGVGSIEWAMDKSPSLWVDADGEYAEYVATIAKEVANLLDGVFVRETVHE